MLRRSLPPTVLALLLGVLPAQGDLDALSDVFEDNEHLRRWKRLAAEEGFPSMVRDVGLHADTGCLHLEPGTSLWLRDFRGPFLFKEVEGDFVLTTRLLLRGKRFATPMNRWSLAGILARRPRDVTADTWQAGEENWISLMTGSESTIRQCALEVRSTRQSQTERTSIPLGKAWMWTELRMVRVGSTFLLLARLEGRSWRVVGRESRPDLPARLQVGLTACDGWMSAIPLHDDPVAFNQQTHEGATDLEVLFDHATFAGPVLPDDVEAEALVGPTFTDEQILAWFGD